MSVDIGGGPVRYERRLTHTSTRLKEGNTGALDIRYNDKL